MKPSDLHCITLCLKSGNIFRYLVAIAHETLQKNFKIVQPTCYIRDIGIEIFPKFKIFYQFRDHFPTAVVYLRERENRTI